MSATVCTPPYILGRLGILMLGSSLLFIPGIFVLALGVTLQAGATGAVRAIKMSATLASAGRTRRRAAHSTRGALVGVISPKFAQRSRAASLTCRAHDPRVTRSG